MRINSVDCWIIPKPKGFTKRIVAAFGGITLAISFAISFAIAQSPEDFELKFSFFDSIAPVALLLFVFICIFLATRPKKRNKNDNGGGCGAGGCGAGGCGGGCGG